MKQQGVTMAKRENCPDCVVSQEMKFPSASWEEAEAFMRHITDGMGSSIDEGILETVIALNLLGFPTCQSCEGHQTSLAEGAVTKRPRRRAPGLSKKGLEMV